MTHSGVYRTASAGTYTVLVAHDEPIHLKDEGDLLQGLIQYSVGVEGGPLYLYEASGTSASYVVSVHSTVYGIDPDAVQSLLDVAEGKEQPTLTYEEFYAIIERYAKGGDSPLKALGLPEKKRTTYPNGTVIREKGDPDFARVYEKINGVWYTPGVQSSYNDAYVLTTDDYEVIYSA